MNVCSARRPRRTRRRRADGTCTRVVVATRVGRDEDDGDHREREQERAERDGHREPPRLGRASARSGSPLPARHQQPDLLDGRRRRLDLTDDPALVHDHDTVGEREDLVEVLADQQDRDSRRGCLRAGRRARSRSRRRRARGSARPRSGRADRRRTRGPSTTFWRLPPDSSRAGVCGPGALISYRSISSRAPSRMLRCRSSGPREAGRLRYAFSTTFEAMLKLGATPVPSRSSGTCAIPAWIAARGSPAASPRPPTADLARPSPPACR